MLSVNDPAQSIARIGIDLGGSNIFGVAFDKNWEVLTELKVDTGAVDGYKTVLGRIDAMVGNLNQHCLQSDFKVDAIGLCVPGVVDHYTSRVLVAPNLGWKNRSVLKDLDLEKKYPESSVVMTNDVNAGLMGEISAMPAVPRSAVAYFCGTGIGGAVSLDGRLWVGHNGGAGEVGHSVVRAGGRRQKDGVPGSLEAYIGKWALNERILRALDKGQKTELKKLITYSLKHTPIKSGTLKKAYLADDKYTRKLMDEYYARYLGIAIGQSCNLLEPEVIVLGGGIMEAMGTFLLEYIQKYAAQHCIVSLPELRLSATGDYAGPRGAAYLALGGEQL